MANDNAADIDRTWELMKKIGFAMLVTKDGDKLRARPMSAYLDRDANEIYFLSDARKRMVDSQLRPNKVSDPRILDAMRRLPRERFLPATLRALAYADDNVPLGRGRVMLAPKLRAATTATAKNGKFS